MEKKTLKRSLILNAPASRVWEIVSDPEQIKTWASAFGHGTHADSDWKVGSEVVWKDMGGNVGAKGIITKMDPEKELRVDFFDDVKMADPEQLGEYSEIYSITSNEDSTTLEVSAGPLEEKYYNGFISMWDRAMENIKKLAENEINT
jgi:uncharacterized protein YndB with AHSA1/START domain